VAPARHKDGRVEVMDVHESQNAASASWPIR